MRLFIILPLFLSLLSITDCYWRRDDAPPMSNSVRMCKQIARRYKNSIFGSGSKVRSDEKFDNCFQNCFDKWQDWLICFSKCVKQAL
ncbi:hypothetical protein SNEBB_008951 [Seison nebaliae]|nr:hypothetical protein SNEBB_008951 [Seison nebaliae]